MKTLFSVLFLMAVSIAPALAAEELELGLAPADDASLNVGADEAVVGADSLIQTEAFADRVVRRVACYARSGRGFTFEAIGVYGPETQERAMNKCYSVSRRCAPTGCRVVYLRRGD